MYQYRSTIGPSRWPIYVLSHKPDKKHMLPRPVVKTRPGWLGHTILNTCKWLQKVCKDIELLTLEHLQQQQTQTSEKLLKQIDFVKTVFQKACEYVIHSLHR